MIEGEKKMSRKVLSLAVNGATAAAMGAPSLARLVTTVGEFPDAVFDLAEQHFTLDGIRIVVRAFRNGQAAEPLPIADPIVVDFTWDELRAVSGTTELESAVRDATWSLLTTHPKLQRVVNGETQNIFAGGELVQV